MKSVLSIALTLSLASSISAQSIELLDRKDGSGQAGSAWARMPQLSADGNLAAFLSRTAFFPGREAGQADVFLRNRSQQNLAYMSCDANGQGYDKPTGNPDISADGRFVVFDTYDALVAKDTNNTQDVYLKVVATGEVELISCNLIGDPGNKGSKSPSVSANGRFVAFESRANNLVLGDLNSESDIFVFDRQTQRMQRVNVRTNGAPSAGPAEYASISANGRWIAFASEANDLFPGDNNGVSDVFVHDLVTARTELVSRTLIGKGGFNRSDQPSISADGSTIAFRTWATNLAATPPNATPDVLVADLRTKEITRVMQSDSGVAGDGGTGLGTGRFGISADGRYISFTSSSDNLISRPISVGGWQKAYRFDRLSQHITLVSTPYQSSFIGGQDYNGSMSADGGSVAFASTARNLVGSGTPSSGAPHAYVREMPTRATVNTAILVAPFMSAAGQQPRFEWCAAPPLSQFWLLSASDLGASRILGHPFELLAPRIVLHQGTVDADGTGEWLAPPIPLSLRGTTLHFELAFRTVDGEVRDSIAQSMLIL